MSSIYRQTHPVPVKLLKFLRVYGGKNPFAQPIWRVCLAQDLWIRKYGNYRDWDENLSVAERGGLMFGEDPELIHEINKRAEEIMDAGPEAFRACAPPTVAQQHRNKPIREVTEIRECNLYPNIKGWIVQRWFPAGSKMIGTREDWEAQKCADGVTPINGPYPAEGDWVMLWGPYDYLPSEDQLKTWIGKYFQGLEELYNTTPEQRALALAHEAEEAEAKRWAGRKREYDAVIKDETKFLFQNGSLGMSRFRNALAKRLGIREHIAIQ